MSYDFGHRREVIGRKPHRCWQCNREIAPGMKHAYLAGKYEGDFYALREHYECGEALAAYVKMASLHWDDAPSPLCEGEWEASDKEWFAEKHPIVFARLWPTLTDHASHGGEGRAKP